MALSERIKQPRKAANHGLPCSIGALLDSLEGDEHAALVQMLGTPERPGWSASEIYDAVTAEGYAIGRSSVNWHRGRRCRCYKGAA